MLRRLTACALPPTVAFTHLRGPETSAALIPNPRWTGKIIELVQNRKNFKLSGQDRLRVEAAMPDVAARVTRARAVLKELG